MTLDGRNSIMVGGHLKRFIFGATPVAKPERVGLHKRGGGAMVSGTVGQ